MAMMSYGPFQSGFLGQSGRGVPVLELLVPMCCTKCQEKVRQKMLSLRGAQTVVADLVTKRVIVHGFVDPIKALKKAKKVKRDSQIWRANGASGAVPGAVLGAAYQYPYSSKYRRSDYLYRPTKSLYRTSSYERRLPISSVYRTSSLEHYQRAMPSVYRASYNQFTPSSYGAQSYIYQPARRSGLLDSAYVHPYSDVITNPHYMKHIDSEFY